MTSYSEDSSTSILSLFGLFSACLGRSKMQTGTKKEDMQTMQVIKVHGIHYEDYALVTATLCIELDQDGKRQMRWLKHEDMIGIPGAKEAIASFRPPWTY